MSKSKRIISLLIIVILSASLFGCGTAKKNKEFTYQKQNEYVYLPTYCEFDEQQYISTYCYKNGFLYYYVNEWNDEEETSTTIFKKIDMATQQKTEYQVELPVNEGIGVLNSDSEGNLWILTSYYEWDEVTYETLDSAYYLKKINDKGEVLETYDITYLLDEANGDYFYIDTMVIDHEGRFFLKVGENSVVVLDKEGKKLFTATVSNWAESVGITKDGTVLVTYYDTANGGYCASVIDVSKKGLGERYSGFPSVRSSNSIYPGIDSDLLIDTNSGLISYNLTDQKSNTMVNWVDSDVDSGNIGYIYVDTNGDVIIITASYGEETSSSQMIRLVKTQSSEIKQKQVLTLGTLYIDDNTKEQIIKFNKSNDSYRIKIIDYQDEANDDYELALSKLNNAITSGNGPDLFNISSLGNTDYDTYAKKGVFSDLYKFFEKDPQIKLDDFVNSILKINEYDGKLLSIFTGFNIQTVAVKSEILNGKKSWTVTDLLEILNQNPQITSIMEYSDKLSLPYTLVVGDSEHYIDYTKKECSFSSQDFVTILELSSRAPSEVNYNGENNTVTKFMKNNLLMMNVYASGVDDFMMYRSLLHKEATFIGNPVSEGSGNTADCSGSNFAINANSQYQDVAWEFIKQCLTYEAQSNQEFCFPILKEALQDQIDEACEPNYKEDENGNQVEAPKETWGYNDVEVEIWAAKQEDIDALMELIDSVSCRSGYDDELYNILKEETEAFFAGAKTAQETADVINSRVFLYINE